MSHGSYMGMMPFCLLSPATLKGAGLFESVTPSSAVQGRKSPNPGGLCLLAAGEMPPGGYMQGPAWTMPLAPPPP